MRKEGSKEERKTGEEEGEMLFWVKNSDFIFGMQSWGDKSLSYYYDKNN